MWCQSLTMPENNRRNSCYFVRLVISRYSTLLWIIKRQKETNLHTFRFVLMLYTFLWPCSLLLIPLSSSLYSARKEPTIIIILMVDCLVGVQGSGIQFIILSLLYPLTTFYLNITAKPEPNMLKLYRLFLPALLKNFTNYSYFILISLPIIFLFYSF